MAEFIIGSPIRKFARRHPRLQRALWRLDFALVWTLAKLFKLVPVDVASRLGYRMGRLIGPRMKRKSGIFRNNLQVAFPDMDDNEIESLLVEAWGRAGRVLAEYPHLETFLRDESRLELDIRQPVDAYEGKGPAVIVSAHLCNWEVVCSALARLGIPNASLYSPATNPYLDDMLAESRKALNCQLLARDNSARLLMRALKSGRSAGLVADRRMEFGTPVEFFGREKLSTVMPARLALKFNVPLVPVQVKRVRDARFRAIFHPPILPREPSAGEEEQALDMTRQLHAQFEQWIREEPADWLCSKRLWWKKKRRYDNSKKAHLRKLAESANKPESEQNVKSNAA